MAKIPPKRSKVVRPTWTSKPPKKKAASTKKQTIVDEPIFLLKKTYADAIKRCHMKLESAPLTTEVRETLTSRLTTLAGIIKQIESSDRSLADQHSVGLYNNEIYLQNVRIIESMIDDPSTFK